MTALIRSTILLASITMLFGYSQAQLQLSGNAPAEETMIEFEQLEYDLGEVNAGDTVRGVFKFKNSGEAPLIIDNVKPSCACTSLDFPQKPVAPGEWGEIKASIDTEDKVGDQVKYFSVIYNGNPPVERVTLRFFVKEKEAPQESPAPGSEKQE